MDGSYQNNMKTKVILFLTALMISAGSAGMAASHHESSLFENVHERQELSNRVGQCGVDAAYMCLQYFGAKVPLDDVIRRTPPVVFERGMKMSVAELRKLLAVYSLETAVVNSGKPGAIDKWLAQGCVAVVPNDLDNHLYVYLNQRGNEYSRYDPPYSGRWVSKDTLEKDWQGAAIIVSDKQITGKRPFIPFSVFPLRPRAWLLLVASVALAMVGFSFRRSNHIKSLPDSGSGR